jgi:hypothetical protein
MRAKIIIEVDVDTGEYSLEFGNLSNPGKGIDQQELAEALEKIVAAWKLKFVD